MANKLFIFAIGGTGERVLRSFTMALASGAPTFNNYDVYPIIIDYDESNADKLRTMGLLQNYAQIHNAAFSHHIDRRANQFFGPKLYNLEGLDNYVFPFRPATKDEKFREYIGFDNLVGDTLKTKELLTTLYDQSNRPDTELNLNMTVGFKGNPNIGSVVFHDIAETEEFRNFIGRYQPGNGDKVVVIGSLFGGTGASGIPEIVKAIHQRVANAKIATILVLPYFAPAETEGGAIQSSRFNSKTKAALNYYQTSGIKEQIDKIYYVGDPYPTVVKYSEGGGSQKNNANLVEFIASLMIEHYVANRDNQLKEFKFSLDADITVNLNNQGAGQRLYIKDFDPNVSKSYVLDYLGELAVGLKYFHEEVYSKNVSSQDFYRILKLDSAIGGLELSAMKNLCSGLDSFYTQYQSWLKELDWEGEGESYPANSHRVAIYDMKCGDNYRNIIVENNANNQQPVGTLEKVRRTFTSDNCIKANNITPKINKCFTDKYFDTQRSDIKEGYSKVWVMADILHCGSKEIFNEITRG